jgi:hypothetical protein
VVGLKTPTDVQNIIVLTKINSFPSFETLAADPYTVLPYISFLLEIFFREKLYSVSLITALFSAFKPGTLHCRNTSPATPQSNLL